MNKSTKFLVYILTLLTMIVWITAKSQEGTQGIDGEYFAKFQGDYKGLFKGLYTKIWVIRETNEEMTLSEYESRAQAEYERSIAECNAHIERVNQLLSSERERVRKSYDVSRGLSQELRTEMQEVTRCREVLINTKTPMAQKEIETTYKIVKSQITESDLRLRLSRQGQYPDGRLWLEITNLYLIPENFAGHKIFKGQYVVDIRVQDSTEKITYRGEITLTPKHPSPPAIKPKPTSDTDEKIRVW